MRGSPTFGLPISLGRAPNINCWSCRVDSWDKTKAEAEIDPWSQQVWRRFAQRLTRFTVLESLFNDTRSCKTPCKTAHVPSNSLLHASWLPPDQGKKDFPRTAEFPIVADPLRYEMQPSPTVLCRKWGDKRDEETNCIPADYPSQVTLHLGTQTLFKQIMRMRTPASPPRHTILAFHTVLRGWAFWGAETILWAFHTLWVGDELMVQQFAKDYPESHYSCFAIIIYTLQNYSIDVNQCGRKFFICSSWSPSWLTASLFHRVNLNLASRGHITARSWSNLILLPEYHLCGAQSDISIHPILPPSSNYIIWYNSSGSRFTIWKISQTLKPQRF